MDSIDFETIENAKDIIKTMQKEDIVFCDYIKLNKQLKKIENAMLYHYFPYQDKWFGNIPYQFDLFNCECSTGKTFAVVTKAILFLEQWVMCREERDVKGMLFVMQNIHTCKHYAKMINEELLNNNTLAETIDSSMTDEEIGTKLKKYPIIFITHEKYKVLAQNEKQRKQFSKNRILLIIDEFINMSEKVWISDIEYEKLIVSLKEERIRQNFRKVTKELKEYFNYLSTNGKDRDKKLHIQNFNTNYTDISKEIEKIKEDVRNNLDNQDRTDYYKANFQRSIYNVLDEIKEFFGGTCILENGKLYTVKRNRQMWGLSNNIVIDGSGTLNYAYYLQKSKIKIRLDNDYKVLDHKNFKIEHIKINTTKSSKKKYDNFYIVCREILRELGKNDTLIVCAKYEHKNSKGEEITTYFEVPFINYWQDFLGSNKYSNLKNMLIIDTFNMPEKDFILEYLYYSNCTFENDEDIKVVSYGKHRHFVNKEIEEYKNRRIANEFYQAFKRINRKLKYTSRIVAITQHTESLQLACSMLENCTYEDRTAEYEGVIKYKRESKNNGNQKQDKYIKAIEILCDIMNNKDQYIGSIKIEGEKKILKKKTLRNLLEISSAPNLKRDVLSKASVKDFLDENNIEDKGQNLIIPLKK